MSKILNRYTLQFKGLKVGKHIINFDVDNSFFEIFEESEIKKGSLSVQVTLNRHNTMLDLDFDISGDIEVPCDRCLEPFLIPVTFEGKVIVKISDHLSPDEEEVWFVSTSENEINLAQYIYESICLSLPIQRYHGMFGTSMDKCDLSMLEMINLTDTTPESDSGIDPRWDKLKDIHSN